MITVTVSKDLAKYLASRTLAEAGFGDVQIGRAMLALETEIDPEPPTEMDLEPYEPSEEDYREYEDYLERLSYERGCGAWTIQSVS